MTLNHLNLPVPDVAAASDFFGAHFGFRPVGPEGRDNIAVMIDDTGFVLSLSNFGRSAAFEYPAGFHVGFIQESRERVDALYERLKTAGFAEKPPHVFHGSWTFYFRGPGGVLVEVLSHLEAA